MILKYYPKKRIIIIISFAVLIMLTLTLNLTFSSFTNNNENKAANIKVAGMNYNIAINGITGTKITVPGNKTTPVNVKVTGEGTETKPYKVI